MIIKDYIVIDNALSDPESLVHLTKDLTFFTRTNETLDGLNDIQQRIHKPEGKWLGFRSQDIYDKSPEIFHSTFDQIFDHLLNGISCKYEYTLSSYMQFSPENCIYDESQIHRDVDTSFAGLIYLNKNPAKNSGTILYLDDGEIEIENKYNRLVFYKSHVRHKVAGGFGKTAEDSRLTLVFFITRFFIDIQNYRKEN